ncbi:carbon-nitrogen hydrolase family protein [Vreelandella nigrificans]|uniref:Nitrilase n=1 Tax=Vreelandella nigrificans TaxID=2042704 RepID=A0A2A4HH39_9GAMM|nr:carbon-nitrogen hydrolase family protein [Halomonas nigrificans]PCF93717.1 nitrilase [Halomonas nigrificans]
MKYKVASIIASPAVLDISGTVDKCCSLIREASEGGAKLVVFPETFLPMYPWWVWMGIDNVRKLELYNKLFENSISIRDDHIKRICYQARVDKVHVVVGVNEVDGGTLYNSQVFINNEGAVIGVRRKLVPTGEERTVWGRGDGSDLFVMESDIGKLGGLICYENSMALSRYALYSQGVQLYVANWPGSNFKSQPRDRTKTIDTVCRFVAFEGQTFVVASSSTVSKDEVDFYTEICPEVAGSFAVGGGIAAIYNPFGEPVSDPITDQEGICYGEVDTDLIVQAKHMIDSVGHYARPDVAQLHLDAVRKRPVVGEKASQPPEIKFDFDS